MHSTPKPDWDSTWNVDLSTYDVAKALAWKTNMVLRARAEAIRIGFACCDLEEFLSNDVARRILRCCAIDFHNDESDPAKLLRRYLSGTTNEHGHSEIAQSLPVRLTKQLQEKARKWQKKLGLSCVGSSIRLGFILCDDPFRHQPGLEVRAVLLLSHHALPTSGPFNHIIRPATPQDYDFIQHRLTP